MLYEVIYQVKYSELWCADECSWMEHVERVDAAGAHEARRLVRKMLDAKPRLVRGRHVDTRKVARVNGAARV